MSTSLLLFNPKDIPYGDLSPLKDNIVSKSYASLISRDLLSKTIGLKRSNDARKESIEIFLNDQTLLISNFLKDSLHSKYKNNTSLLDIKGNVIVYLPEKNNFVGKYLTDLREKMKKELEKKTEMDKKDFINKVYSIVEIFTDEFRSGNNTLENYINKNVDEIIKQRYLELKPINIVNVTGLLGMKQENFNDINYFLHSPESIASVIRSSYNKEYNENIERKNKEDIISYYIDNLVNQNVKDKKDRYLSKKNLLCDLEKNNQLDPLINRLVKLKELGQLKDFKYTFLPIKVVHKVEKVTLPDFIEPIKLKQIKKQLVKQSSQCQSYNIEKILNRSHSPSPVRSRSPSPSPIQEENEFFYIDDESVYSPYFMEPIIVHSFTYPSVMHYVRAKQFEWFGFNMFTAHEMVKDKDHEELKKMYDDMLTNYIYKKVTNKSSELLLEKYKYTEKMSKNNTLLLSTINEYKNIIFNDREDFLLGIGDGSGQNFIGKYLEKIRDKLFEEYGHPSIPVLKQPKVVSISNILKDEDILLFTTQKVKDLYSMMKQSKENFKYTDIESFYFIYKNFLDCISQIKITTFNKDNIPHDFETVMGIKADKVCLSELWKYTFFTYAATKQVNNWKLLIAMRDYKSIEALKDKKEIFEWDSFDAYKNKQSIDTIKGENILSKKFSENIIKQSDKIDYSIFKITDESEYSSLLPKHVKQVSNIFQKWFKNNSVSTIVDATAHIGVDSVNFSIVFPKALIHSYEINENTFNLLKQNVSSFDRIHVTNINFTKADLPEDISFVYIDAPWGGRDYKQKKIDTLELFLGKENVKEVARRLLASGKTNTVVLKVPFNYHFSNLNENFMVEREDVKDGNRISYTLLKLTLLPKYLIKQLAIKTFINIFKTIDAFKNKNDLNVNYINFAFKLVFLGKNQTINIEKESEIDQYYQDIIISLLKDMDMEEMEIFKQSIVLSNVLKQCIEQIINSIDYLNQKDVINRILLFSTSKKFKSNEIKHELEQEEEVEELFVSEVEQEEEEEERVEGLEDEEEEEEDKEDKDEKDEEEYEEDKDGGFDYDIEYEEDEYQNTD